MASGPCLVWLPMRLGISEFNPIYTGLVKRILACPLSVGLGGGRPKSSYYFFGYTEDDLLYLDPHITRPSIQDPCAEEQLNTYRGDATKRMPMTAIDPCFVAAFLLREAQDYEAFARFVGELKDPEGSCLVSLEAVQKDIVVDCSEDTDFIDIS